jgi:hypothetical protein
LDSILRGYPFPEIYLADGEVDLETGQGTQLLVDGLQRVSTMIQYFNADPELKLTTVSNYKDLSEDEKKAFLQYDVAVRDLGAISKEEIVEVFKRINATKYSLTDIEVNNAVYVGALKQFAERVSGKEFFSAHNTFTPQDYKRMGDLRYALQIVITILGGYTNRDDEFKDYLDRYNDDFPTASEVEEQIDSTLAFIDECGFSPKSRVWRKADLFSLIVELNVLLSAHRTLQPSDVVERVERFFAEIDTEVIGQNSLPGIYYKATVQASNDRTNRMRRGLILNGVIVAEPEEVTTAELRKLSLVS